MGVNDLADCMKMVFGTCLLSAIILGLKQVPTPLLASTPMVPTLLGTNIPKVVSTPSDPEAASVCPFAHATGSSVPWQLVNSFHNTDFDFYW